MYLKAQSFVLSESDIGRLRSFAVQPVEYWSERKGLLWN